MKRGDAESDNDSAENAHLERVYADDLRDTSLVQAAVRRLARDVEQCRDRCVHYEKRDRRRESCGRFFAFSHTERDSHCENYRQIVKNYRSDRRKHAKDGIEYRALAEDIFEPVAFDHCRIRQRSADAEQQTRDRQKRDREHKRPPDPLKHPEKPRIPLFRHSFCCVH